MVNILVHLFSKAQLADCALNHFNGSEPEWLQHDNIAGAFDIRCYFFLKKKKPQHLFPIHVGILEDGASLNGGEKSRDQYSKVEAPGRAGCLRSILCKMQTSSFLPQKTEAASHVALFHACFLFFPNDMSTATSLEELRKSSGCQQLPTRSYLVQAILYQIGSEA